MIYRIRLDKIGLGYMYCECDCTDRSDLYKHIYEYGLNSCDQIILIKEGENIIHEALNLNDKYFAMSILAEALNREDEIKNKVKENAPCLENPLENPCQKCALFTTKYKIGCLYKRYCDSWKLFDKEYTKHMQETMGSMYEPI